MNDKLQKLNKMIELMQNDTVTPKEIEQFLNVVLNFISKSKDNFEKISKENLANIVEALNIIEQKEKSFEQSTDSAVSNFDTKIQEVKDLLNTIKKIKTTPGKNGYTPIKGVDYFDGENGYTPIKGIDYNDGKNGSPDTGFDIVSKVNLLPINEENQIDASHIKNLPEGKGRYGGSTARNLWQLNDVAKSITEATNGQSLVYNTTTKLWEAVSAGSSSPLTTKGDLYTYTTTNARLPVGTNGQVLSANSATATGLEWITAPSTITLQTNGTPNGSQTLLNLIQGTNTTLIDNGVGGVTFDLTVTPVTAGTYTYSTITVDTYGRLTAASSGSIPTASLTSTYVGYGDGSNLLTGNTNFTYTSGRLNIQNATDQLRLLSDASNYLNASVGSTGTTTFNTAATATNMFNWQYNGVTKYTLDKTGVTTATDVSSGGTIYTVVGRQRDTSQNDYYLYSYVVATDSRIALALGRFNGQGYIKLGSGPYDNATLGANYNIWNGSFGNEGLEVNTQGATQPYVGRWAVLGVGRYNSSYDTVEAGLRVDRNSDGTPQAGFGSAVLFQNQSTTTVRRDAGQIASVWSDATDASRTAEMVFSTVYNGGSLAEGFRLLGNGVSKLSFDGSNYFTTSISNTGDTTFTVAGTNADFTFSQAVNFSSDVIFGTVARLKGYTVATLPIAPVLGDMVYVTDALAPAFGVAVAGGGAANAKLWYNGANWTVTGV